MSDSAVPTVTTAPRTESPTPATGPLYSVVVPVFGSEPILPDLVRRLDAFFDTAGYRRELIFVVDGSPDESWEVLRQLRGERTDIVLIDLIRNYGQHSAVFCGLQQASGDFVITIDDDLQNPPEEIAHLIRKVEEGYDVVFGEFHRKMHGVFRRIGSRVVSWLNRRLFRKPKGLVLTNVRIIRRHVVDAVCGFRTASPYVTGLLLMSGKTFANVPIAHHPRPVGRSNYGMRTIAALVWRLVFNYSAFPLRLLCGLGLVVAFLSFGFGFYYLIRGILVGSPMAGWLTLVVLLSFFQGMVLTILAAIGEYLVRILGDVSGREAFRIRSRLG